jgi:nucleoid-associated protein YgaU
VDPEMTSTDLSSCGKHRVHTLVSLRRPLSSGFTVLLCSCLLFGAAQCRAQEKQGAPDAARQESARKEQAKQQNHVYTEDDLGHVKILTPEDEARFAASRKEQVGPGEQPPTALEATGDLPQLPLGDIARRYRDAKRAMQAPTPFHLPFDEPAFASLIAPVTNPAPPRPSFTAGRPNVAPTRASVVVAPAISSPTPLHRVDPFARRSVPAVPSTARIAPSAPVARVFVAHPAPAPATPPTNLPAEISAPKFVSPKFAPVPLAPTAVAPEIAPPSTVVNPLSPLHIVTVQPGDSLWKLAQQNLGRGSRWPELLAANPGIVDPTRLAAGTHIVVPTETSSLPHVKSDAKVAVQKGDTLTKIAQSQYGRAAAWSCIAQANPQIVDADRIYEGQQLLLPFACNP